ncbi:peptidoglycan-binding protein [Flavobacterium psychrophilum]|uniref:LysM domain-containing protein n=5 Tax=Flavobacterium psychrophilum TaxID=96345 RepID=A6H0T7_FLAPJ|nr:LysM domain-containing protein [Flavobacterium psychrophilum]AIG30643.1 peptidoglycan-binding protein [Flavobacterium psychrophilum]AIG32918.1 peptidoglycan-binding protein [Flavobacterium psychrophilum]AIG35073.1 peptidoglycan-binding protein [Flavobacterium psychrophilum]AIG37438.1 peptidoglycan-binding protein [Flavobacterium psychrophilum]AIG39702.1 peptidoglycan-binding protein [Flavobacterium psychrophilum]
MKYLVLLFLCISNFVFAQQEKTLNHKVIKGENIFQIAKTYNITPSDIYKINPGTENGIQENQILIIPNKAIILYDSKNTHQVQPKETLFGIARLYNVSVQDLDNSNTEALKDGLQIGENIVIPNKKKTLNGQARIINAETIFHIVASKETKYSISKKYGISIEQLETQNPEIINGLIEGNKLAINTKKIKPNNDNEELMIALAEKQAAIEKNKAKTTEIEDLQDKLTVQKQMNQKVLKVNSLKVNLNEIDETKGGSAKKLKLVLEANKNIQEILISKLDSLVVTMSDNLETLKNKDINDLEESKNLEKDSYKNISETNGMIIELKKDLADNRKIYTGLMTKVQRITLAENHEYKKKINENQKIKNNTSEDAELLEVIKNIQTKQEANEKRNKQLFTKIDSLGVQKNIELKRRISKATFYSSEARDYDDKLAQVKLKRYQNKAVETNKKLLDNSENKPTAEQIKKALKDHNYSLGKAVKIEILRNLKDIENGYYIIADTFSEAEPRDLLTRKLTDSGEINTGFFYNVNIFSYYVFTKKLKNANEALFEYNLKKENPLYKNMFIVQIEKE